MTIKNLHTKISLKRLATEYITEKVEITSTKFDNFHRISMKECVQSSHRNRRPNSMTRNINKENVSLKAIDSVRPTTVNCNITNVLNALNKSDEYVLPQEDIND